jgi:SH3 domain-containing YSC84-like protein 1
MKRWIYVMLGASLAWAATPHEHEDRLANAASTLQEIMTAPDQGIPQTLLDKAECIVIVPGLKKGAFIVGASYGKGYMLCRRNKGAGWAAPGTVRMEGGSFGFQIGGSETDVILLVMNDRGVKRLLSSQFTLGGEASVAAGPVGRSTRADTDALMTAEMLSWSRTRGVFAGISLQGATLRQDVGDNRDLYGKRLTNKEIVQGGARAPKGAQRLIALLNKYSSRRRA